MAVKLKPVSEQVIVITGASSGIGLSTARMAAKQGARLVLAARSEQALRQLRQELEAEGAQAVTVNADVGNEADVRRIAQVAQAAFGGFDTWINNAGVGMYGRLEDLSVDDMRRLFETNFWGLVYGSRTALEHLRDRGGSLINLGSTVSDRAIPLQGIYAASKHAIKGFTDALRMELEADRAPVSVTLIKPGPIDTPFPINAKNYLDTEPQHVPPVYAPDEVARAILHAAATPTREVYVGSGGRGIALLGQRAPRLTDRLMERMVIPGTLSGKPPLSRENNALDKPSERLSERGNYPGMVRKISVYTEAKLHPGLTLAVCLGSGLAMLAWQTARRR
ncbi:SDR family oxidoreductase [Deinococcus sp.]|uniref:SDR family oxidoreductase n=1 Tax=Deinococcus sp. TaxID=47478 RepID=UPI003C7E95CC